MEAQSVTEEAVKTHGKRTPDPRVAVTAEPASPRTRLESGATAGAGGCDNGAFCAPSEAIDAGSLDEDDWFLLESEVAKDGRPEPPERERRQSDERSPQDPQSAPVARGRGARPRPQEPRGLAALVGMATLPVVCPEAPRVEIAIDAAGGLHLLVTDEMSDAEPARIVDPAGASSKPGSPGDEPEGARTGSGRVGVAALLAAEAWVSANIALVRRALPAVTGRGTTLHLMTRTPAGVRDLLGARIRVHLLVSAGGQDVCVALN